ncbi:MAG: hypothetical protein WAL50_21045 [Kineosporiaceae bacterium]
MPDRGDFSPNALAALLGAGARRSWPWWDASHDEVLASAEALTDCAGPEDLERATAELIGDHLWQRLQTEVAGHNYLEWVSRLIDVIEARRAESGAWLLAHGLAAICPQPHRDRLLTVIGHGRGEACSVAPLWLPLVPQLRVDGDPQVVVDGYGVRYGLMVDLARPGKAARTYLIDLDLCLRFVSPPSGWHADLDSALAAWRAQVGPSADGVRPQPAGGELLVQLLPRDLEYIGPTLMGNERRDQLAEFFRMRRVVELVRSSLGLDDTRPPPIADEAVRSRVDDFLAWCADRDVAVPDREAADWLVTEWLRSVPPAAGLGCSPHRIVTFTHGFHEEWRDGAERRAAVATLPRWIGYCLDRSAVPDHLAAPCRDMAGRLETDPDAVAALGAPVPQVPTPELDRAGA